MLHSWNNIIVHWKYFDLWNFFFLVVSEQNNIVQIISDINQLFLITISAELIKNWSNEFSNEILIKAIEISIENDKRNMKYICGILRNWSSSNLKTICDIDASMKKFTSGRNGTNVTQLASHKKIHNFDERPKYSNDELEKMLGVKK